MAIKKHQKTNDKSQKEITNDKRQISKKPGELWFLLIGPWFLVHIHRKIRPSFGSCNLYFGIYFLVLVICIYSLDLVICILVFCIYSYK